MTGAGSAAMDMSCPSCLCAGSACVTEKLSRVDIALAQTAFSIHRIMYARKNRSSPENFS